VIFISETKHSQQTIMTMLSYLDYEQ